MRLAFILLASLAFGCQENKKPEMLMHEHSTFDGGSQMAIRRVPVGRVPVRRSHGVDAEAFGEAPPEIEFTRDDVMEFDATEEVPDALAELREVVPTNDPVSILEGKVITFGGQVGRFVTVPPSISDNGVEVLTVRSEDALNSMFTVTLAQRGINPPGVIPGREPAFIQVPSGAAGRQLRGTHAWIQWGAGGAQFEALVDVGRGQTFSVGGSYIRIIAFNTTNDPQDVGAIISLLPRSGSARPTFTQGVGLIPVGPGTVNTGEIPAFARALRFYRTPFATTAFRISFINSAPGPVVVGEVDIAAGADCPEILIPNNAGNALITNTGAVAIAGGFFVYQLSL